jgi:hypothetical protein
VEQELSQEPVSASNEFTALYDLSEEEKLDRLNTQKQRLDASIKFMETLYPQMLENFKKYRSIADKIVDDRGREVKDEPNIFVPYPYGIVESELPRLAGKLPRIRIAPRKEVDSKNIDLRQDYLYYAFDRMKFLQSQTLWIRQFSIYGWSPLYYYWRKEMTNVLTVEESPDGSKKLIKKETARYDDFWCRVLDVFDSFMQPGVTAPEDGDWFIFRELVSKQDLKKLVDAGIFYNEVREFISERKPSGHADTGRDSRDELIGMLKDASPHSYGKYELYWCLEDDRITCTLGTDVLCMVSDNPNPLQKKPVLNCNLTELINEPIGISTIEAMAGLPDKLNALTNARLKNISLQLGKVFLANRNARVDWDNFVMDSGNLIFTDDIENTAKELQFADNTQNSEREILTTKEEMQFTLGVSDYIVGVKSGARLADTATGVSTIVKEANARYGLKQAAYESGCLRELVIACDAYSKLYLTDEKRIYVFGPNGFVSSVITPEDLAWDADLMVEPGSVVPLDNQVRAERLSALLDRVVKMPNVVRIDKYMQQVLEANEFRNVDELLIPQDKTGTPVDDVRMAEAENISLQMGQPITLTGNDQIHLGIHSKIIEGSDPRMMPMIQEHVKKHQEHLEALQQQLMAQQFAAAQGGMNGGNPVPNQPGGGAQAGTPQGTPGMASAPKMAGPAGGVPNKPPQT